MGGASTRNLKRFQSFATCMASLRWLTKPAKTCSTQGRRQTKHVNYYTCADQTTKMCCSPTSG